MIIMNRCTIKNLLHRRYSCFRVDTAPTAPVLTMSKLTTTSTTGRRISYRPQHCHQLPQLPLRPLRHFATSQSSTPPTDTPIVTVTTTTSSETSSIVQPSNNNMSTTSSLPPPRPLVGEERSKAIRVLNEGSKGSPFQWEDVSFVYFVSISRKKLFQLNMVLASLGSEWTECHCQGILLY